MTAPALARRLVAPILIAILAGTAHSQTASGTATARAPNDQGRIPILEYHLVGGKDTRWGRSSARFRRDLELLYERGYRPITVAQLVDGKIDIPAGTSPVVFTFDDASPGQLKFIERNGKLEVDPESAVGVWLEFGKKHPEWQNRATFCLLSGATEGHAFFGEKGIAGQKSEWRFEKLRLLVKEGFELCAHTLWHANLGKYDDRAVQEQIARSVLAIDSAVAGYRVRTFALPLGMWPKNRALATAGQWRDARTGREVKYNFDAVLLVAGPPVASPASSGFNPMKLGRVQVFGDELERLLDRMDAKNQRFVSGGVTPMGPKTVAPR
jgi:hypothetical protein